MSWLAVKRPRNIECLSRSLGRLVFGGTYGRTCTQAPLRTPGVYPGNSSFKLPRIMPDSCRVPSPNQWTSRGDIDEAKDSENCDAKTTTGWSSLSNEEFLSRLAELRQSIPGFCPSMLSNEERTEFYNKRGAVISECSRKVSNMIGDVDLVTPLLEYRQYMRRSVQEGEKEIMGDFRRDDRLKSLRVKKDTKLALDTQIFVYLAQRNVAAQHDVVEAAERLMQLPFEFVVGATTYTEISYVLMRDNTQISGLMAASKGHSFKVLEAQLMVALKLRNILIAVKKRFNLENLKAMKLLLSWATSMVQVKIRQMKAAKVNVAAHNRAIREEAIASLYKEVLDVCTLADYDGGRQSLHEDFEFMKSSGLKAYDAHLVRLCADIDCQVFLTHDKQLRHASRVTCSKRGSNLQMMFWDPIQFPVIPT